ncbi:MAG: HAMP domain-containing protein [Verrucomicrobia bacterium]|nr:HAMP domain-containing protein [Verrucomicrobiota bacterium]
MKMSIWQRLNTTLALMIVLLLAGFALAWWIEYTRSESLRTSKRLDSDYTRLRYNMVQMSDALRSSLLKAAASGNEAERKQMRDAELDLQTTFQTMRPGALTSPVLADTVRSLRDFTTRTFVPFHTNAFTLLASEPATVREQYQKDYDPLLKQRDQLFAELRTQIDEVRKAGDIRATRTSIIGSVLIFVVAIGAFFVARLQSSAVTIPLNHLVGAIERMRLGDFTQRVTLARQDEFGILGDGLNRLADDLSVLVGQVQRSGIQVNMTATEIAATAREQQSTTTEIAANTAEIGATSREISATSKELDKTMTEVRQVADHTTELANQGQTAIARMETNLRQIMDASRAINTKLAVLNDKTANINTVVTTITKVADQTNLLSLNAAIEAEKAGEYGLGFAVVAMEIRRLADQTAVATYDIEKMVKEMQSAVAAGVMSLDKFSEEVRHGVEEIRQVSTQLAQIIHQVQTLTPRFQTVSEGMHAQSTGAQQISETLSQLSEAAHQTADSLRQSNLAIEQLNEAARGLQTSVARFQLEPK